MSIAATPRRTTDTGRHRGDARRRNAPETPVVTRTRSARLAGPARALVRVTGWVVLASVVAVFAFLAVGPHVLGYRTATMLTGSMEPMIKPGDVVVSVPKPVEDVAVGDVISYHIPVEDNRVETHRVIDVTTAPDGRPVVQTKGDANPNKDPWTATLDGDVAWETVHVVPHLGTAIRALRNPLVQTYVLWGAIAGLLVVGMASIWRRDDSDDETSDDTDGETSDETDGPAPVGVGGASNAASTSTIVPSSARGDEIRLEGDPRGV